MNVFIVLKIMLLGLKINSDGPEGEGVAYYYKDDYVRINKGK